MAVSCCRQTLVCRFSARSRFRRRQHNSFFLIRARTEGSGSGGDDDDLAKKASTSQSGSKDEVFVKSFKNFYELAPPTILVSVVAAAFYISTTYYELLEGQKQIIFDMQANNSKLEAKMEANNAKMEDNLAKFHEENRDVSYEALTGLKRVAKSTAVGLGPKSKSFLSASPSDVKAWLANIGLGEPYADTLSALGGSGILQLSDARLVDLGVQSKQIRELILDEIQKLI